VEDGSGAHGAGFEGDVEGAAFVSVEQSVVFEGAAGVAEGDDFGVGSGIVVAEDAVLAAGDDFAAMDDDGADGDFAGEFGGAGFVDGGVEVVEVVHLFAPPADLGLGFGAEEAGDLLGEGEERGATLGERFVIVREAVAPGLLDDRSEVGGRELRGGEVSDGGEDGFFFRLVFVRRGAVGDVTLGVGCAD